MCGSNFHDRFISVFCAREQYSGADSRVTDGENTTSRRSLSTHVLKTAKRIRTDVLLLQLLYENGHSIYLRFSSVYAQRIKIETRHVILSGSRHERRTTCKTNFVAVHNTRIIPAIAYQNCVVFQRLCANFHSEHNDHSKSAESV